MTLAHGGPSSAGLPHATSNAKMIHFMPGSLLRLRADETIDVHLVRVFRAADPVLVDDRAALAAVADVAEPRQLGGGLVRERMGSVVAGQRREPVVLGVDTAQLERLVLRRDDLAQLGEPTVHPCAPLGVGNADGVADVAVAVV